jgi:general nucleoside transport system ATP-binding protein
MSPAIEARDVEKTFGAVRANRGATLTVAAGEIHALVGENGAGKSTLMRVLAGMYQPEGGTIRIFDRDVTGWRTADAIEAGVSMVHQHFMLVPTLTVAENVVLGHELRRGALLDPAAAIAAVEKVSRESGLQVPARRYVSELSVGEAQRVEIVKALFQGARVLILDEPTAVLSPPEVADLWRVLRRLRDQGTTIVLITHKLDEVCAISDTITVMRHGQTVARMATAGTTPAEIARAMVGRDVVLGGTPDGASSGGAPGGLVIERITVGASGLPPAVNELSLHVAPGEIVGVAGVEGNGQTELIEAIAGLRSVRAGSIKLNGVELNSLSVAERLAAGVAHIPEDRHRRGLLLDYTIADNLILGLLHRYTKAGGTLDRARIHQNALEKIRAFDIRPADPHLAARGLSGGNQQKIVIARELGRDYELLLAAQPTRGVDVGATEFIHAQVSGARRSGRAVLLVSADLQEVLSLSDRVVVMYRGRIVADLPRADADQELIGRYMTGAAA